MKPIKLKINTKTQHYSIIIGSNLLSNISKILKENSIDFKQCLLIIDKTFQKKLFLRLKNLLIRKKFMFIFLKLVKLIKILTT